MTYKYLRHTNIMLVFTTLCCYDVVCAYFKNQGGETKRRRDY